jgi:hypothetical protein
MFFRYDALISSWNFYLPFTRFILNLEATDLASKNNGQNALLRF